MMIEPEWRNVSIASVWRIESELSVAPERIPSSAMQRTGSSTHQSAARLAGIAASDEPRVTECRVDRRSGGCAQRNASNQSEEFGSIPPEEPVLRGLVECRDGTTKCLERFPAAFGMGIVGREHEQLGPALL